MFLEVQLPAHIIFLASQESKHKDGQVRSHKLVAISSYHRGLARLKTKTLTPVGVWRFALKCKSVTT